MQFTHIRSPTFYWWELSRLAPTGCIEHKEMQYVGGRSGRRGRGRMDPRVTGEQYVSKESY